MKRINGLLISSLIILCACSIENKEDKKDMEKFSAGSFGYDLDFLKEKDSVFVLKNNQGSGQIIVSAKYQGKVFTSTARGPGGKSFGWINYKAFDGELDPHMNAYGGEDRLWLGPEGGPFSIFFKPATPFDFENWKTPSPIDSEHWEVIDSNNKSVSLRKDMVLQNYAGNSFNLRIDREISILENEDVQELLDLQLSPEIESVAFKTSNKITNTGNEEWNEKSGALCLWNLDMLAPSPNTVIVIPFDQDTSGKVATTDYFGEIPQDRIHIKGGFLYFKADGKSRGKLGLPPQRAMNLAASYNAEDAVLTIVKFDVDKSALYLNQEWTLEKDPFSGDAVNAYNDGPLEDGNQMGPFYELESVSPAAFLKPGESLSHEHSVFHFVGNKEQLNTIAIKVIGISISQIETIFK